MSAGEAPVTVCLGSGGVGKTTLAACFGIAAADRGERVVVLTIDPARRLATALGLDEPNEIPRSEGRAGPLGNEPTLVEGPWAGELYAAMLDPSETIQGVIDRHGDRRQRERLSTNPLFKTVVGSLSGSNEYLAAERLHQLYHDPRFDRVIIDTPPSRHAIDFLDSPERLTSFVDNRLYRAVFAPRKGLMKSVNSAAQLVFRLTARLVGADLVDNVIRLFQDLEGLDDGFRRRAAETAELLNGPDCRYVLITTPRYEPMREAGWIQERLSSRGHVVDQVVVNRLTPYGRQKPRPAMARDRSDRDALIQNWDQLAQLALMEDELIDKLRGEFPPEVETILLPEQLSPMRAVEDLAELAGRLPRPS